MLASTKEHARVQTELLQAKTKEVDQLRIQKATDDVSNVVSSEDAVC